MLSLQAIAAPFYFFEFANELYIFVTFYFLEF